MATYDCSACSELAETSPEFMENGVTDSICASLHDNTGFNPNLSVLHEDEEDLHDANDCLVGRMADEVASYDVCDWKTFMKKFIPNLYNVLKAIICSIGGLWDKLAAVSYIGILTLYASDTVSGDGSALQRPAFDTNVRQGNMPSSVLQVKSGYDGIVVKNTLSVPILVESTFNSSIRTDQPFCCCYLVVTRNGQRIGQTPFIVPSTYDQQVMSQPFILQPGESATMSYYFHIGVSNAWFIESFGGTGECICTLDKNESTEDNQRSYFSVRATSIVSVN